MKHERSTKPRTATIKGKLFYDVILFRSVTCRKWDKKIGHISQKKSIALKFLKMYNFCFGQKNWAGVKIRTFPIVLNLILIIWNLKKRIVVNVYRCDIFDMGIIASVTEVFSKPIFSTLSYLSTLKATAFLSLLTIISSSAWFSLKYHRTHQHIFRSMFHFYTPRKHQKATSFFILSRGIEGKHWLDIG